MEALCFSETPENLLFVAKRSQNFVARQYRSEAPTLMREMVVHDWQGYYASFSNFMYALMGSSRRLHPRNDSGRFHMSR